MVCDIDWLIPLNIKDIGLISTLNVSYCYNMCSQSNDYVFNVPRGNT